MAERSHIHASLETHCVHLPSQTPLCSLTQTQTYSHTKNSTLMLHTYFRITIGSCFAKIFTGPGMCMFFCWREPRARGCPAQDHPQSGWWARPELIDRSYREILHILHGTEQSLFAYHSQTKGCGKEELNTCQNEFKMTAAQDTNLTSQSSGQAKKGLLRIQALQEGVLGFWAQGAPSPPFLLFPMASRGPSVLLFLTMRSVWALVCQCLLTLNFSIAFHCSHA